MPIIRSENPHVAIELLEKKNKSLVNALIRIRRLSKWENMNPCNSIREVIENALKRNK